MKPVSDRTAYLFLAIAICFWASAFPGIRFMLRTVDPMPFTSMRLTVTSLTLLTVGLLLRFPLPEKADLLRLSITGLLGYSGYHVALNLGLDHVTAGEAGFIIATIPLWTTLLAWRFLGETITRFHIAGTAISLAGIAVLTLSDVRFEPGALFVLLAAMLAAGNMTMQKSLLLKYAPTKLAVYTVVIGCLPMVLFGGGASQIERLEPVHWVLLLYLGAVPIGLGFWLITVALRTLPAVRTSQGILFVPPLASIIAYFALDEAAVGNLVFGGGLVLAGVVLSMRSKKPIDDATDHERENQ